MSSPRGGTHPLFPRTSVCLDFGDRFSKCKGSYNNAAVSLQRSYKLMTSADSISVHFNPSSAAPHHQPPAAPDCPPPPCPSLWFTLSPHHHHSAPATPPYLFTGSPFLMFEPRELPLPQHTQKTPPPPIFQLQVPVQVAPIRGPATLGMMCFIL